VYDEEESMELDETDIRSMNLRYWLGDGERKGRTLRCFFGAWLGGMWLAGYVARNDKAKSC
jgi:hypothetical protein